MIARNRAEALLLQNGFRPCPKCAEPIRNEAIVCRYCNADVAPASGASAAPLPGSTPNPKTPWKPVAAILFGVIVLAIWPDAERPSAPASPPRVDPKAAAIQAMEVADLDWRKGGFGTVLIASFSIKNHGARPIKDPQILCVHSADSGTLIGNSSKTVYEAIQPGASTYVHKLNLGFIDPQTTRVACAVYDLTLM